MGLKTFAEVKTNIGRIDTVIKVDDKIFLFEFKFEGTAVEALNQIKKMKYYEKYMNETDKIYLFGVSFSMNKRGIVDWKVEQYSK